MVFNFFLSDLLCIAYLYFNYGTWPCYILFMDLHACIFQVVNSHLYIPLGLVLELCLIRDSFWLHQWMVSQVRSFSFKRIDWPYYIAWPQIAFLTTTSYFMIESLLPSKYIMYFSYLESFYIHRSYPLVLVR